MLELNRRDKKRYSIRSAIAALMNGGVSKLDGLERECHQELEKEFPQKTAGVLVPNDLFEMQNARRRDLSASNFGSAGAFVQTTVEPDIIPILRNKLCVQKMGARVVSGLEVAMWESRVKQVQPQFQL